MATIAPPQPAATAFPKADAIRALVDELLQVARAEAQVRGIALPPENPKIIQAPVPLDSLSVVDTLCAVEQVLDIQLRDSIVRTGGYNSIEKAIDDLLPKIERVWVKKKGSKP